MPTSLYATSGQKVGVGRSKSPRQYDMAFRGMENRTEWWLLLVSDPLPGDRLIASVYLLQLVLSSTAVASNLLLAIVAFVGDSHFSPYQAMFRVIVFVDLAISGSYLVDSLDKSLLRPTETGWDGFVTISDCSNNKVYLYAIIACRQWGSHIILTIGVERLLFMRYPLWFKSIRVQK